MIGTSCPPFITLFAMREALMAGLDVEIKNILIKKPACFARMTKSILSCAEKTVSKTKLFFSARHLSRSSEQ